MVGSPHCVELLDSEEDLLVKAGSNPPKDVLMYPKLVLANRRVLLAEMRSKATKRDNSCLLYNSVGVHSYGIVQKIIVFQESATIKCFLLLKGLEPAPLKLCNDQLTHANLENTSRLSMHHS